MQKKVLKKIVKFWVALYHILWYRFRRAWFKNCILLSHKCTILCYAAGLSWDAETWLLKLFNQRLNKHAKNSMEKSDQTVVGNFPFIHYRPWHSSTGYFQFIAYTTDLGIQAVGNSNIAHRVNIKSHIILHHFNVNLAIAERNIPRYSWTKYNSISIVCYYLGLCYYLGRRMEGVTSGLGGMGLDAPNYSNTPDGMFKYPSILFKYYYKYYN